MRLLYVIGGLAVGGAESQVIALSRQFARLGHEVSVYVLNGAGARSEALSGSCVELILDRKRQRIDFGVLGRLRRHIRRWRPDLVHGFKFDGDLYARIAAWGSRVPVLNSERTDHQEVAFVQRAGYRLTAPLCDGIVANTYGGAEFARRLHRLPAERVDVVWNGLDMEEVQARIARSQQPARQIFPGPGLKRLCMVAALKPQNDYPLALRTLRRLVDRDGAWRLICAGDEPAQLRGGYRSAVLAEIDRLQLAPYVQLVGHRRDVLELIASSELLLMSAAHGGFPNVALEAMATGVPVVSTDYGDVRRILPLARQVVGARAELDLAQAVLYCDAHRDEIAQAQRKWLERYGTASASAAVSLAVYAKYRSTTAAAAWPPKSPARS